MILTNNRLLVSSCAFKLDCYFNFVYIIDILITLFKAGLKNM